MRGLLFITITIVIGLLQSCNESTKVTELEYVDKDSMSAQRNTPAFEITLHPLLKKNCASCHGSDGPKVKHSSTDPDEAMEIIFSKSYVNFSNAADSYLVKKIRNGHQCGQYDCDQLASTFQTEIENWAILKDKVINLADKKVFNKAASALVFKTTTHPILQKNCFECHGSGGNQAPRLAVADYETAHDSIIDTARVSFKDIPSSRLVVRLRKDKHNCWSNSCEEDAKIMEASIEAWKSKIDTSGYEDTDGVQLSSLGVNSADIEEPHTILGSIVLQAEEGVLEGRFKIKDNSKASGFKYISGDTAPRHPLGGTERVQTIRTENLCGIVKPEDISDTINGRYQLSERKRHPDVKGYSHYSKQVRMIIIRPQYRDKFYADLKAKNYTNMNRYYLTNGVPSTDDDDQGLSPIPLTGGSINKEVTRILPEFYDHAKWTSEIEGKATKRDFFAPKHGELETEYYTTTEDEIRVKLPDGLKRKAAEVVMNTFKNMYYKDGNPVSKLDTVPKTLRKIGTTEFVKSNAASSKTFYEEYLGDLTIANALDLIEDADGDEFPRLFKYVYFYIDGDSRSGNNFSQEYINIVDGAEVRDTYDFNLQKGPIKLDLSKLYTGGSKKTKREIIIENYGATVKKVLQVSCVQCHGDESGGRPQFALNNDTAAYDAAASVNGFIRYGESAAEVRNARPLQQIRDRHQNCGGDRSLCNQIETTLTQAFIDWTKKNKAGFAKLEDQADDSGEVALLDKERTPGRAKYKFKVTEAGDYNVWLKLKTNGADGRKISLRILDEQGRPQRNCSATKTCDSNEEYFEGKTLENLDKRECKDYNPNARTEWEWFTPQMNSLEERIKWPLKEGKYTLELVENEIGVQVDLIAISANPEFNPAKNLIDEGIIQSNAPKILKYDLKPFLGLDGKFEIEVVEKSSGDAYIFRNPRFSGIANKNIHFSDIKILVNNKYEYSNSTYTKLNRVVNGWDSGILTTASIVALVNDSSSTDSFSFVFKDLSLTDQPEEALDEGSSVPVEGRECLNLELFENSVMPILNNFKLMRKDEYLEYASGDFPGRRGREARNKTQYNCTTCHNEEHPFFKMTTFAKGLAPGQPIPKEGLEKLCAQALSRVDFGNFERSLLLRGINGTFNHPKLHFIQKASFSGSGNSRKFVKDQNDPSGYKTEYIGNRFDKWDESSLNISSYSNEEDKNYLRRFVGEYKRIKYQKYSDPYEYYDGQIKATGDTFNAVNGGVDRNGDSLNLYTVNSPEDRVGSKPDGLIGGPIQVRDDCVRVSFKTENGVTTDPCNSNGNVDTEFENLKQVYRESLINWMREEKKSYYSKDD